MAGIIEKRENDALHANPNIFHYPPTSNINITTHGSDLYWAITAVMAFSTFIFIGLASRVERRNRLFHYITASITLVASIAYFTMASNLGYAAIIVEFQRSNPKVAGLYREVFYVRYIDWVVTTPLLLLDVLLTAGLPWPTVLITLLVDEIMIITGLVGALVASSYKWGYFVFAMFALFFIAYNVMWVGRKHANALGGSIGSTYMYCAGWTMFLWFLYPIAWGLSEGGNVIAPDSEAIFYSILDVLAKPGFGALLLWGHRNIDPATLGLYIRDYDEPLSKHPNTHGHHDVEKSGPFNNTPAHNNGNSGVLPGSSHGATTGASTGTGVVGTHANQSAV